MARTQSSAHAVYRISYHFVWTPKYRKKVLKGEIAERMEEILQWGSQEIRIWDRDGEYPVRPCARACLGTTSILSSGLGSRDEEHHCERDL